MAPVAGLATSDAWRAACGERRGSTTEDALPRLPAPPMLPVLRGTSVEGDLEPAWLDEKRSLSERERTSDDWMSRWNLLLSTSDMPPKSSMKISLGMVMAVTVVEVAVIVAVRRQPWMSASSPKVSPRESFVTSTCGGPSSSRRLVTCTVPSLRM